MTESTIDFGRVKALTFDCYGTIVDWETGILEALEPLRERYGIELGDEAVLAAFGRAEAKREAEKPSAPYPEILADCWKDLVDEWDVPADEEKAAAFAATIGEWPLFPDSKGALKKLKGRFVLGLLSNVDRASFARTAAKLGFDLDEVMTAEEIGSYKPDPRNFEFAIARFAARGIDKSEIVHVAQSLYHDHVPAQGLGLQTVWVNRRAGKSGSGATVAADVPVTPDLVVESLADLLAIIDGQE